MLSTFRSPGSNPMYWLLFYCRGQITATFIDFLLKILNKSHFKRETFLGAHSLSHSLPWWQKHKREAGHNVSTVESIVRLVWLPPVYSVQKQSPWNDVGWSYFNEPSMKISSHICPRSGSWKAILGLES